MSKLARFALGTLLLAWCTATAAAQLPDVTPAGAAMSATRLARIDSVMNEAVTAGRTAGVAVLVARDGRIVKAATYGWSDRETARPLRRDALFRIASQTKAVTSVAALVLVEEGRLRLADPAHRWIPGLERVSVLTDSGSAPLRRPITIRDLLTHTAGLSYGGEALLRDRYAAAGLGPAAGWGWYFADKEEPICASMDRLARLPIAAQPGERFVYGYASDLLGCIIERVAGVSLEAFVRARIFEPLRMSDTWFFVPVAERDRLVTLYAAGDGELVRAPDGARGQGHFVDGPRASFSGGAGLVSTMDDYARFLQMLLNGGELDGARILSPHGVALLTTDQLDTAYGRPGFGFSLGFEILEDPGLAGRYGSPGSYGWGGAYATTYWVDPAERLIGIIMTQTLPAGGLDVADRFRTLTYAALEARPATAPPTPDER
jgi:CubicO group peptidase (beta-lactamase class C family)